MSIYLYIELFYMIEISVIYYLLYIVIYIFLKSIYIVIKIFKDE